MKLKVTFFCLLVFSLSCMPFPQGYQQGAFPSSQGFPPGGAQQNQQVPGGNPYTPNNNPPDRTEEDYREMKARDRNRDEVLDRSRSRRRGDDCGDQTRGHECKRICREIYKRRDDREDCEDLTANQVYALADVYDILKDPKLDDLLNLDIEDINVFLNLSIAGLDNLIGKYSKSDAKKVLTWIAEDEDIAEELIDGDDEFKSLEKLLEKISRFSASDVEKPFGIEIDNDFTLFELAFNADNESVVEWVLDYVFHKSTHCNDDGDASDACFTVICKIGYNFEDEDMRTVALDFSAWTDFFDDAISRETNKNDWCPTSVQSGGGKLTSSESLEDPNEGDWVKTLCGGKVTGVTAC